MTVAVIGVGALGEALVAGMLRSGVAPGDVVVCEQRTARAEEIADRYGVRTTTAGEAARGAEVVFLVTKPYDVPAAVAAVAPVVAPGTVVVTMAAGVPLATVEGGLPGGIPVVRVMTNTPLLLGHAMSVLAAGAATAPEQLDRVSALLGSVGRVLTLPESQLDAVTALSGSGPAYLFLVAETLADAGVLLGLPRPVAAELAAQTVLGSGAMLVESGEHPARLREMVTSPGGTTAVALRELEGHGLRAALLAAVEAACARSRELAGS